MTPNPGPRPFADPASILPESPPPVNAKMLHGALPPPPRRSPSASCRVRPVAPPPTHPHTPPPTFHPHSSRPGGATSPLPRPSCPRRGFLPFPVAIPPTLLPSPRSGFQVFQCFSLPPPSHSSPRSGIRPIRVEFLPLSPPSLRLCLSAPLSFVAGIPPVSRSRKFFPIVGKRAKNFSNHWKTGVLPGS